MIAVSGSMHSCGVSAILHAERQVFGAGLRIVNAADFGPFDGVIPVDAKLEPFGKHADAAAAFRETNGLS